MYLLGHGADVVGSSEHWLNLVRVVSAPMFHFQTHCRGPFRPAECQHSHLVVCNVLTRPCLNQRLFKLSLRFWKIPLPANTSTYYSQWKSLRFHGFKSWDDPSSIPNPSPSDRRLQSTTILSAIPGSRCRISDRANWPFQRKPSTASNGSDYLALASCHGECRRISFDEFVEALKERNRGKATFHLISLGRVLSAPVETCTIQTQRELGLFRMSFRDDILSGHPILTHPVFSKWVAIKKSYVNVFMNRWPLR